MILGNKQVKQQTKTQQSNVTEKIWHQLLRTDKRLVNKDQSHGKEKVLERKYSCILRRRSTKGYQIKGYGEG